jgi:hypothetical protein
MELPADYWDLTPGVELTIFPAPATGYQGAFNPKGVAHAWRLLTEPLTKFTLGRISLARLKNISVEHEPGPATDTRADGSRIVVADGHVRAASLFAYAAARLLANPALDDCYKLWFDLFLDALAEGDPVVPLDNGYSKLLGRMGQGPIHDEPVASYFKEIMYGFVCFLLAHEAAHILLGHSRREEDAARIRQMELDADRAAVELTVKANVFGGPAIAAWSQWQAIRSLAALINARDGKTIRTHPPPVERLRTVLQRFEELEQRADLDVEIMVDGLQKLIGQYQDVLAAGRVDELFGMRHRPARMSTKEERTLKRLTRLRFCLNGLSA